MAQNSTGHWWKSSCFLCPLRLQRLSESSNRPFHSKWHSFRSPLQNSPHSAAQLQTASKGCPQPNCGPVKIRPRSCSTRPPLRLARRRKTSAGGRGGVQLGRVLTVSSVHCFGSWRGRGWPVAQALAHCRMVSRGSTPGNETFGAMCRRAIKKSKSPFPCANPENGEGPHTDTRRACVQLETQAGS